MCQTSLFGGFWFYNSDFFNSGTLDSLKSLNILSKELHLDNQKILDVLKKFNTESVYLNRKEIHLLSEIKDLLVENKNILLEKSINENQYSTSTDRTSGWGAYTDL